MANELNLPLNPETQSGLDIVAILKEPGGFDIGDPIQLSENGNTAFYSASMPEGFAQGHYIVCFYSGSSMVGVGEIFWNGNEEIDIRTVDLVRKALLNNMKVNDETNMLIIYDDDGESILKEYNLFNLEGQPSSVDIRGIEIA